MPLVNVSYDMHCLTQLEKLSKCHDALKAEVAVQLSTTNEPLRSANVLIRYTDSSRQGDPEAPIVIAEIKHINPGDLSGTTLKISAQLIKRAISHFYGLDPKEVRILIELINKRDCAWY